MAIGHSLAYLQKLPPERIVGEQPRLFTAREIQESLTAFDALLDRWHCRDCLAREIAARFELIPSSTAPQEAEVLFTGYYQPVIDASLTPGEGFRLSDLCRADRFGCTGPGRRGGWQRQRKETRQNRERCAWCRIIRAVRSINSEHCAGAISKSPGSKIPSICFFSIFRAPDSCACAMAGRSPSATRPRAGCPIAVSAGCSSITVKFPRKRCRCSGCAGI